MVDDTGVVRGHDLEITGAGGLALAATSWGPAEGDGVLFLHGFGQTRHAWDGVAERIAGCGWQVLAPDMRGHGDSPWADAYRLPDFIEDVRAAADWFASPPVVVGASFGGILALFAHHERPLARALGLVDVVPHFDRQGGRRVQAFMAEHREGFASLDEAAAAVDAFLPNRQRPDNVNGLLRNFVHDPGSGRYRWKWDPRFASGVDWLADAPGDLDAVSASVRDRMTVAAKALSIPTLLVRGRLSNFVSEEAARAFLDLVPHAVYADVLGAGHMVAGDRNDAFGAAVLDFLGGLSE